MNKAATNNIVIYTNIDLRECVRVDVIFRQELNSFIIQKPQMNISEDKIEFTLGQSYFELFDDGQAVFQVVYMDSNGFVGRSDIIPVDIKEALLLDEEEDLPR